MFHLLLPVALATAPIGLEEALQLSDKSPEVSAAAAAFEQRRAGVDAIAALSSNPVLAVQPALRTEGGVPRVEGQLNLSQSFNLEHLQGARKDVATHDAAQARATILERAWLRRSAAARAWLDCWAARASTREATSEAKAADELVRHLERALGAGGVSRAEVQTARAFAAEAQGQVLAWEGRQFDASAQLAMLLGLDEPAAVTDAPTDVPAPDLDAPAPVERHPQVRLLEAQVGSAQAREREASALWGTSLHVSLFGGYEAQAQWITGVGVGLSLPVFERGQAEVFTQRAAVTRLTGERTTAVRRSALELKVLRHELEHTSEVYALVHGQQLPASEEALRLETRRFEQAEITVQELLVLRRQVFGARLAELTARADLLAARIRARELLAVLEEKP